MGKGREREKGGVKKEKGGVKKSGGEREERWTVRDEGGMERGGRVGEWDLLERNLISLISALDQFELGETHRSCTTS